MPQQHDTGHRKRALRGEPRLRRNAPVDPDEAEDYARSIVMRGLASPAILDAPLRPRANRRGRRNDL